MTLPTLDCDRFRTEHGLRVTVQVPEIQAQRIIDAVLTTNPLPYGDYDSVTFTSQPGRQRYRSLGSGRNAATRSVVEVACVEMSFFLSGDEAKAIQVLKAIYAAHPYEEPVILVTPCLRTLHIRGLDEDNPNRFWNDGPQDWLPKELD